MLLLHLLTATHVVAGLVATPSYAQSSFSASDASATPPSDSSAAASAVAVRTHTLILCRHGDSVWNGGHPGHLECFTGWSDVALSPRGVSEASATAQQLASTYPYGIDACFTSILQRARLTAHECVWAYGDMPKNVQVGRFVSTYHLNERHYGALQGFVKADVEAGMYGHDPELVQGWRRSWHAVPPLLEDDDPRRIEEIRMYGNYCGGPENVPRGESLQMVATDRIRPWIEDVLSPTLDNAVDDRIIHGKLDNRRDGSRSKLGLGGDGNGGTGLVVAHANSLRALIGILCGVENDPDRLHKVEQMKIQTGVPLVLKYKRSILPDGSKSVEACNLNVGGDDDTLGPTGLPIWPLASIPSLGKQQS